MSVGTSDPRPRREAGPFRPLLVTDLDGTAVDKRNQIARGTIQALEVLRRTGWDVTVATGRMLHSARQHMISVGSDLPAIVYDGGRIMKASGVSLWEVPMSASVAQEALRLAWESGMEVQLMADELIICRPEDWRTMAFLDQVGAPYVSELIGPVLPSRRLFRVMLYDPDPSRAVVVGAELRSVLGDRVEIVAAGDGFLDVLPSGVSKGAALDRWLDQMGRCYRPVVAVGDNENDLELLLRVDLAVAVSTAPQEVLDVASWVIPPPDDGGPEELVSRLIQADLCDIVADW
ncbi:MAG: hypothetical protein CSA35_01330 [Dethiosulfovibrio peptidovorans]|nr:MAG: hypothetical protein CSA35_01330 [Dethiosulfovibrio peptidovorans]